MLLGREMSTVNSMSHEPRDHELPRAAGKAVFEDTHVRGVLRSPSSSDDNVLS